MSNYPFMHNPASNLATNWYFQAMQTLCVCVRVCACAWINHLCDCEPVCMSVSASMCVKKKSINILFLAVIGKFHFT